MPSEFTFHGDLPSLLRPRWRYKSPVIISITRRASIKDVVESFGLPHTEVGRVECNDLQVDFSFPVEDSQKFNIYGVETPWDITRPSLLRPEPLKQISFVVDVNVGRLARYLRMAGFDTLYDYRWDDNRIVDIVNRENRIVLSKDLGLLKRKQVGFGRCVRAEKPIDQLDEIICVFGLTELIRPFRRCLECNSLLIPVAKNVILPRLEPLTRKYYTSFSMCTTCDKIYWSGSHRDNMKQLLTTVYTDQS